MQCNDKVIMKMIAKMIQSLEDKMQLQINTLETRIQNIQEMFNKDLEVKKNQSIINNIIAKIKNTRGGGGTVE